MKALIVLIILAQTSFVLAEEVICKGKKNVWHVTFELGTDAAHNIKFYQYGELYKNFGSQEMTVTTIRIPFTQKGIVAYDVKLGGAKYIDFERKFNGNHIDVEFPATFLLTSNPFSFEKHVVCKISQTELSSEDEILSDSFFNSFM